MCILLVVVAYSTSLVSYCRAMNERMPLVSLSPGTPAVSVIEGYGSDNCCVLELRKSTVT